MKGRVLLVDDDESACALLHARMTHAGYESHWSTSAEDALESLGGLRFDAVVTDIQMGSMDGLELCRRTALAHPTVPVVVVTAFGTLETAITALRAGAYDFLTKPFGMDSLCAILDRATHHGATGPVRRGNDTLNVQPPVTTPVLGRAPRLRAVLDAVACVAGADASVLITGESGTGKNLIAAALHARSHRHDGPWVTVRCSALADMPWTLHDGDRGLTAPSLVSAAHGGTLFLDEVCDLSPALQARLLGILQDLEVAGAGAPNGEPAAVRVVAATRLDLESEVRAGRFREDLFYRLDGIRLVLPPLRDRGDDVDVLARHFLEVAARRAGRSAPELSPAALARLREHRWPGNVRELQNWMARAVALGRGPLIAADDLPATEKVGAQSAPPAAPAASAWAPGEALLPMDEIERMHVLRVLHQVQGNKTAAAQVLGMDRKTLYRKLDQYAGGRGSPSPASRGAAGG